MNVRIALLLDEWAETDGRGVVTGPDGGYILPDGSIRNPDAAWTSLQRLRKAGMEDQTGFASICPDFIIELRSKSDRLAPLEAKMEMWIANGAQLAWLIDPERKVVAISSAERWMSARRVSPEPSRTGAKARCISSMYRPSRYCRSVATPPPRRMSFS